MSETTRELIIRRAGERGLSDFGWLQSRHTFAFGMYHDTQYKGFGPLRVINDDIVAPGAGFGEHGHRDMEILTWVLQGALQHQDDLGNGSIIQPGELQAMTAGAGIRHSEFNASKTERVHFLQIWIMPHTYRLTPRYAQKTFSEDERRGRLCLLASGDEHNRDAVHIHQDAALYTALLDPNQTVQHHTQPNRRAWLHVARGTVNINDHTLDAGDGIGITDPATLTITATHPSEVLLFDLP